MPAYSFQKQFVPFVKDGSKRQTIRKRSKKICRPGDTVYLYYAMRTKKCEKIGEAVCTRVDTIIFNHRENELLAYPALRKLTDVEVTYFLKNIQDRGSWEEGSINELAYKDGFRPEGATLDNPDGCWELMKAWLIDNHKFPFVADIIYW